MTDLGVLHKKTADTMFALSLIHIYTEDVVILPLMERLQKAFPDILFQKSQVMHSPAKYL